MAGIKLDELKLCLEELEKMLASTKNQKLKDILHADITEVKTEMAALQEQPKLEGQESSKTEMGAVQEQPKPEGQSSATAKPFCYDVKLNNYAWDESDKFVKIYVTLKNVQSLKESDVYCQFKPRSFEMHAHELDKRNYHLAIGSLLEEIDVDKSYWKVKTDKVMVYLVKSTPGHRWSYLTVSEKKAKEPKIPKPDPNDDSDPSLSFLQMMKQMYEQGDDEVKRTIAKAWVQSKEKQSPEYFDVDI